jgi:hypothetical protein
MHTNLLVRRLAEAVCFESTGGMPGSCDWDDSGCVDIRAWTALGYHVAGNEASLIFSLVEKL